MPERRYAQLKQQALIVLFGITCLGAALALALSFFKAARISRPIDALVVAARQIAEGNVDHRVEPDRSIREIAALGEDFNRMAQAIRQRDERLRQKAEEQLARSERLGMVGRLAAGVAHEINNPLGGIMLFSNLVLRKCPPDAPERESLERIAAEARRCQKIVQGLLDFARPREPKVERLQLDELMDKTLQLLESEGMLHDVEVATRYGDAPPVRADAGQIQEVFLNILLNALEAMKEHQGKLAIVVEAAEDGRATQVSITDAGCGISESELERVFEPFFTTKDIGHGTGLGLSVSRGIVEKHGGSIWASSEMGEGATFFVRLPAVEANEP